MAGFFGRTHEPGQRLYLMTRDDPADPMVVRGTAAALIEALGECWGFEYVIVDSDFTWAVFDNHHSVLVICGEPPGYGELDQLLLEASRR